MPSAARHAASALIVGGVLGLLGDLLFYDARIGVNFLLWATALALAGFLMLRRSGRISPTTGLLLGLLIFFAATQAWRASEFLRFWNLVALVAAGIVLTVHLRGGIVPAWLEHYARGAMESARTAVLGPVLSALRLRVDGAGPARRAPAVLAGVALAIPVIVVFGGLLVSADPFVEGFVQRLFGWDLERLVTHLLIIGFTGWFAAGWLSGLPAESSADRIPPSSMSLFGPVQIAIPLGALVLILAAFVGLQTRYLFGGDEFLATSGLTYAEFARRGFFELVVASALVVPLLLGFQRFLNRDVPGTVERFRPLAAVIVGLVALVMVSAVARMLLYMQAYGLTEDRFYATAFMFWVGTVLGWLVYTELRSDLGRFVAGPVFAGFALLAALNAANPDAIIARVNINRALNGQELDVSYLDRLSPDAVPVVVEHWNALDPAARDVLHKGLLAKVRNGKDWREWTWSQSRAAAVRAPS